MHVTIGCTSNNRITFTSALRSIGVSENPNNLFCEQMKRFIPLALYKTLGEFSISTHESSPMSGHDKAPRCSPRRLGASTAPESGVHLLCNPPQPKGAMAGRIKHSSSTQLCNWKIKPRKRWAMPYIKLAS